MMHCAYGKWPLGHVMAEWLNLRELKLILTFLGGTVWTGRSKRCWRDGGG